MYQDLAEHKISCSREGALLIYTNQVLVQRIIIICDCTATIKMNVYIYLKSQNITRLFWNESKLSIVVAYTNKMTYVFFLRTNETSLIMLVRHAKNNQRLGI